MKNNFFAVLRSMLTMTDVGNPSENVYNKHQISQKKFNPRLAENFR